MSEKITKSFEQECSHPGDAVEITGATVAVIFLKCNKCGESFSMPNGGDAR